jgi:hypothetical protein
LQYSHADTWPACGLHTHRLWWWQSHADRDGYSNSYSHRDSDGYGYSYSYSNGDSNGDSYWGTASNSVTAAAANTGASPLACSGTET